MKWLTDWEVDDAGTAIRSGVHNNVCWVVLVGGHEWPGGPPSKSLKAVEMLVQAHGPEAYAVPDQEEYPEDGQIEVATLEDRHEDDSPPVPFWTARFRGWTSEEGEEWKRGLPPNAPGV